MFQTLVSSKEESAHMSLQAWRSGCHSLEHSVLAGRQRCGNSPGMHSSTLVSTALCVQLLQLQRRL